MRSRAKTLGAFASLALTTTLLGVASAPAALADTSTADGNATSVANANHRSFALALSRADNRLGLGLLGHHIETRARMTPQNWVRRHHHHHLNANGNATAVANANHHSIAVAVAHVTNNVFVTPWLKPHRFCSEAHGAFVAPAEGLWGAGAGGFKTPFSGGEGALGANGEVLGAAGHVYECR